MPKPDIYEIRKLGRDFCQTEGSEHYKNPDQVEPIELTMATGHLEGFCIGNIEKYAARYARTKDPADLRKVSDYAQILCGYVLMKLKEARE